ncbi:bidirectional sugar transporter SWEET5-like isoform X2 [Hordeum vulgare subsp. vulgare]|uniref:bidirectional sugar transporter SWEET5-like isoform X2 n=1 Tax=Hordeum vulgare subsp. vulgare TaxID=112509 RepID=UPI0002950F13|nr:bidirectional sugar transporter SWEET5-like isoform X2 [Hordeum vulgare subsp. vulgare]
MDAKNIVGIIGAIAVGFLVVAPVRFVFRHIIAAQDVGVRHCLPYAFTCMNAAALVFYGGNRKDLSVIISNGFAFFMENVYCVIYLRYSHGWRRILAVTMFMVEIAFLGLLLCLQFVVFSHGQHPDVRDRVFGSMGAVTAFFMYASTGDEIYRAHMTHNVDGMEMAFAYLGNAAMWTAYACIPDFDLFLLIANGIGLLFSFYEAALWIRYRNAPNLQAP